MIRDYIPEDFSICTEIVNKVWNFDDRFKPRQLSDLFKRIYTGGSLSASNFAVVIEENNLVQGFLFGKCGNKNLISTEFGGLMGNLKSLFRLFSLKGISLIL